DIICSINLQHNCVDVKCRILLTKPIHQEHIQTSRNSAVVNHELTPEFFLNVYSIHNYMHISNTLPKNL
ncbi:hypothetical protein SCLCIDRAFT_40113, partial [Scleroderma citrinum Foug A]